MVISLAYVEKELAELQKQLGLHEARVFHTKGAIAAWEKVRELILSPEQQPHPSDVVKGESP